MTQEEKVALLKEAGVWDVIGFPGCIDKLIALVAAHECEARAKVRDDIQEVWLGDEACIRVLESGDYIESLMEHLEVEIDENQIKLEELEKKKKRILSSCAHWMSCNDGSYEMALDGCGYYKIVDEIKQLKAIIQA